MTARTLIASAALALAFAPAARAAEPVGTSTADAASLQGEFVIVNPSDVTIHYQVKWGEKGEWKSYSVKPGFERRHWHPLNAQNKAPAPFVRFDNEGGDGKVTNTELHVKFGRVGYTGYNAVGYVNEAIRYQFKYRTDGRHLDLNEK